MPVVCMCITARTVIGPPYDIRTYSPNRSPLASLDSKRKKMGYTYPRITEVIGISNCQPEKSNIM